MTYRVTFWLAKWDAGVTVEVDAADHRTAEERARAHAADMLTPRVAAALESASVEVEVTA